MEGPLQICKGPFFILDEWCHQIRIIYIFAIIL